MDVERETIVEVGVSAVTVGLFILAVLAIGVSFGAGGLGEEGAYALIGLIVGFILLMTVVGYWLSGREA